MKYISVGDMSQTYLMRRHNVQLKSTMAQLSEEVISGISQDVGAAVGGDFTALSAISRSQARVVALQQTASEADLLAGSQQDALEVVQGHAYAIGSTLISAASSSSPSMVNSGAQNAAERFASIIGALNVSVAGRYAFSGITTDTRPVADPEDIMAELTTLVNGMTSVDDITAAVDAWFEGAAGSGGFIDKAYKGSATTLTPVQISDTDEARLTLTATDPTLRDVLKGFALATLVAEDAAGYTFDTRSRLIQAAGERIVTGDGKMATLRSDLGAVESIIADAQTRNSAQKSSLQLAKTELIGVDPYETATALDAVQSQLESLYTLTSRLSQLSLMDYL